MNLSIIPILFNIYVRSMIFSLFISNIANPLLVPIHKYPLESTNKALILFDGKPSLSV